MFCKVDPIEIFFLILSWEWMGILEIHGVYDFPRLFMGDY